MDIKYKNILLRNATTDDAEQLCKWWNDGSVMAHAGFPNGLNTTVEEITERILSERDETTRRFIIMLKDKLIGEMNYRNMGDRCAK